ncbi:MAG: hypothetical protein ACR2Q4_22970 [Geminicoccaceae bacterium]
MAVEAEPAAKLGEARDRTERRGLTGTISANQSDDRPWLNYEAGIAKDARIADGDVDMPEGKDGRCSDDQFRQPSVSNNNVV